MWKKIASGKDQFNLYQISSLLILLLLFSVYIWSAPPHTTPEDASEFILMAHTLGLAHPPGYPLHTLLAHPLSYLGFLSPALRITLLSMLSILGSAYLVGLIILRIGGSIPSALVGLVLFAISSAAWSQAIVTEVYSLHAFLMTLLFYLGLNLRDQPSRRNVVLWLLLFSLSLCNHWPLSILCLPAFVVLLWNCRLNFWQEKAFILPCMFLGLSPYLYLFLPGAADFSFSGPIESLKEFFDYVKRREYNSRPTPFNVGWDDNLFFLREFVQQLVKDHGGIGLGLAVLGGFALFRKSKVILSAIALGISASTLLLLPLWRSEFTNFSLDIFTSLQVFSYALLAVLMGYGLQLLLDKWPQQANNRLLWGLLVLALMGLGTYRFQQLSMRDDNFLELYSRIILDHLPPHSILLTNGDADAGPLAYQHVLRKERPDIELVSAVGALLPHKIFVRNRDIRSGEHRSKIIDFINAKLDQGRRVFAINELYYFKGGQHPFPFVYTFYGWFAEISRQQEPISLDMQSLGMSTGRFLDEALAKPPQGAFRYLRYELIEYACRFLVIFGMDHPALKNLGPCQYSLAEWLYWEGKDYRHADKFFRLALSAYAGWPLEENLAVANRILDTHIMMLRAMPTASEQNALLTETRQLMQPFLEEWPDCNNTLARRLTTLGELAHFSHCSWYRDAREKSWEEIPPFEN